MINRLDLLRSVLFSILICLLVWDALLWLTDPAYRPQQQHRELLLAGFLLWFASAVLSRNRDNGPGSTDHLRIAAN
jgi:hypothetical protein